ncbi:hypothetical protein [Pacificoceanicola onchidii]|uniref:hypothetical protein n=1 Tax=Pacificoceanicola onchidii TaxID=2562685 RepID=UPI0010A54055|nr:hypothetical protein [Pacificoceanicola onchidii]
MTSLTEEIRRSTEAPGLRRSISVGGLLITLYLFFMFLVVISFSAYVLRSDWDATLAANGGELSDLDSLGFLIKREAELEARIAEVQTDLQAAEKQRFEMVLAQNAADAKYFEARRGLDENMAAAQVHIRRADSFLDQDEQARLAHFMPEDGGADNDLNKVMTALVFIESIHIEEEDGTPVTLASVPDMTKSDVLLGPQTEWIARRIAGRDRALALKTELKSSDSALRFAGQTQLAAQGDLKWVEQRRDALADDNKELQEALTKLRTDHLPIISPHRARYSEFYGDDTWVVMQKLVPAPTILLTLMATIAAGALGTLVSFSRASPESKVEPTAGRLMINIAEGIAAAIAVFLFAGAGMLVLTQGGGVEDRLELSSFTVAFLAFLSGFMSEQAFNKIRAQGGEIFGDKNAEQNGDKQGDKAGNTDAPAPEPAGS